MTASMLDLGRDRAWAQDGATVVGVERLGVVGDRETWRWYVVDRDESGEQVTWEGSDLSSPAVFRHGADRALVDLACFMEAYVEAQDYPHSDNRDIFTMPPEVADRAAGAIRAEFGFFE